MAKALGIGGIFFKSHDPYKLGKWYKDYLGILVDPPNGSIFYPDQMPERGFTVWAPFKDSTTYFEPSKRDFMFNLVVDNLTEALKQIKAGGGELIGEIEEHDYGRFGWFVDPEGNKVELWEPSEP